jgi:hypothetical protein
MPWNKDGSRKTAYYKKSGFTPYKKGEWTSPLTRKSSFLDNGDKDFSDETKYKHMQPKDARSGIVQDKETGKFYSKNFGHEMDSTHHRNTFDRNIIDVKWHMKESPKKHNAKNKDGTYKDDNHAREHEKAYKAVQAKKKERIKNRNKRKEGSTTQPFIGRKI